MLLAFKEKLKEVSGGFAFVVLKAITFVLPFKG